MTIENIPLPAMPEPPAVAADPAPKTAEDRMFDEVLKPLVEQFYGAAKTTAELPGGEEFRTVRAWQLGRMDALENAGNLIAATIGVAEPLWSEMRDMAVGGGR